MTQVVVDFESYYNLKTGVSVTQLGNDNYYKAADAYCVAISHNGEVQCGTIEEMRPLAVKLAADPTVEFWAANSNFDEGWWRKYYPEPASGNWQCLLDVGRGCQMGTNLAALSKQVLLREMDKSTRDEMNGIDFHTLSPERQEEVLRYCLEDVQTEAELLQAMTPLTDFEKQVAAHTRVINRRGVHVDLELIQESKTTLEKAHFEAFRKIPWVKTGEKALSMPALVAWCESQGIPAPESVAKTDEDCTALMSQHPKLNEVLTNLRSYRHSNMVLEKIATLLLRTTEDGRLPLDLIYCGAPHTKRFSSKGFNVQNLDKKPTEIEGVGSFWSRNWLIPPPGCQFLILDFSQVEPRCLNWLVGNEEMMAALRKGFSYYEAYAGFARGWKGAPGSIKKEYGVEKYTLLKNECLGLGYGMGAPRFIDYGAQNGVVIPDLVARRTVAGFRANNKKIVDFWGKLDSLIRSASQDKSKMLEIAMPTGDVLRYFTVRAARTKAGKVGYAACKLKGNFSKEGMVYGLWGGAATENVTQRFARDILAAAVLRLEAAGFPVIFHAHDEVILAVEDTQDPKKLADIKAEASRIMSQPPEFAPDIPLGVDGDFAPCYTKA